MPREYTRVTSTAAPTSPAILSEDEVEELFGFVLEGLPPPPVHFTLYFKFESEELTDESRRMLTDVLQEVKGRPVPDVVGRRPHRHHRATAGQRPTGPAAGDRRAHAAGQRRADAESHRGHVARRSRAPGEDRRRRVRTAQPARGDHRAMKWTQPRLALVCGLVPTLLAAVLSLTRPAYPDPRRIRRLRHAGARDYPSPAQPARGRGGRRREEPDRHRPVAVAPRRHRHADRAPAGDGRRRHRRGRHLPGIGSRRQRLALARQPAGRHAAPGPHGARLCDAVRRRRGGGRALRRASAWPGGGHAARARRPSPVPGHRRRVQPAAPQRGRGPLGLPERGTRRRRHPAPGPGADGGRGRDLSQPGAGHRGVGGEGRKRGASRRQRQRVGPGDRRILDSPRWPRQPAGAVSRRKAHLPLSLGGRRHAGSRVAARGGREAGLPRHDGTRHAGGGGDAARHAVRGRGGAGHGRGQPAAGRLRRPAGTRGGDGN